MESYQRANSPRSPGKRPRPLADTNLLAIASLVLGITWLYWIGSILAVVAGHTALRQIGQANGRQQGGGMAVAGIVLGWTGVVVLAVVVLM
jgi:hypothetical protein